MAISNPYANMQLQVPDDLHGHVSAFASRGRDEDGNPKDIDEAPFERMVDVWWFGFCVGVANARKDEQSPRRNFVTGVVFNEDPSRIRTMELVALGDSGSSDVLKTPGQVISTANAYSAAGLRLLIDRLVEGKGGPLNEAIAMAKSPSIAG